MLKSEESLLKGLPINFSTEVEGYKNKNISILRPDRFIVNIECCFENYHLAIPSVQPPPIRIGKREYIFKANRAMVANPEQSLLVTQDTPTREYIAMFIGKSFIQDMAYDICGRREVKFTNDSYVISKRLMESIESFTYECSSINPMGALITDSISTQIGVYILREINNNIIDKIIDKKHTAKSHISKAVEYIEEYYNSNISLNDLCSVSNLSPYHFIRIFRAETGKTPHEYLLDKKISKAIEIIRLKDYSINEVAQLCGFVNQSHFSTVFKKKVGVSPQTYKKELIIK